MPQFLLEIPNCEETISSPLVISVLNRIIRTYKWYKGFDFQFLNLGESILVKGSEIDVLSQDRSQQRLATDTTVFVETSERYNEEMSRASAIGEGTQKNIFVCPKTKITMQPGYQHMIVDISMRFRFTTRHAAENFRKRVRLASTKSVDGMRLEVKYNYTVPYQYLYILKHAHDLMENKHGYGVSFGDWLKESFTKNLTTLSNQSGGKSVLAIAEINQGVLVLVQSPDETPQKDKDGDGDAYTVTMEFEVMYDRPDVMRIKLPHIIHNQSIDFKLLNRFKPQTQDVSTARTHIALLDSLKTGAIPIGKNMISGASSPVFDDWLTPFFVKEYPDLLRSLLLVGEEDRGDVMNLREMTDWEFTEDTLKWLIATNKTIGKKNFNILWFRLWSFDKCESFEILEMDKDLNLRSKEPLDPRKNYHLTIGINIDPSVLDKSVWDELKKHPGFLREWLGTIAPDIIPDVDQWFRDYYDKFKDTSDKSWHEESDNQWGGTWDDMPDWIKDKIRQTLEDWASRGIDRIKMKSVMLYGVMARKSGVEYDA